MARAMVSAIVGTGSVWLGEGVGAERFVEDILPGVARDGVRFVS